MLMANLFVIKATAQRCNFARDVAILDLRERTTSTKSFVLELVLRNYNPKAKLSTIYVVDGLNFYDNGKGDDKISGDGIYTSDKRGQYVKSVRQESIGDLRSRTKAAIFNPSFDHETSLRRDVKAYPLHNSEGVEGDTNDDGSQGMKIKLGFGIECDLTIGGNDCWLADQTDCCDCCPTLSNCTVSANVGLEGGG